MGTDLVTSLPSLIPPPTTTPEIKDPCTVSEARTTWQQNWKSPELYRSFPGGTVVKNLPANAGDIEDASLIPGLGRSPGGGHGNPLQCSCLENPMVRGAWWATVHGFSPWGQTQPSNWTHTLRIMWRKWGMVGVKRTVAGALRLLRHLFTTSLFHIYSSLVSSLRKASSCLLTRIWMNWKCKMIFP